MKKRRRIFAVFMTLLLIIAIIPSAAFASEMDDDDDVEIEIGKEHFDDFEDGEIITLTIKGTEYTATVNKDDGELEIEFKADFNENNHLNKNDEIPFTCEDGKRGIIHIKEIDDDDDFNEYKATINNYHKPNPKPEPEPEPEPEPKPEPEPEPATSFEASFFFEDEVEHTYFPDHARDESGKETPGPLTGKITGVPDGTQSVNDVIKEAPSEDQIKYYIKDRYHLTDEEFTDVEWEWKIVKEYGEEYDGITQWCPGCRYHVDGVAHYKNGNPLKEKFTVKYVNGTTDIEEIRVEKGDKIDHSKVEEPKADGYVFTGWELLDGSYNEQDGITKDLLFDATWEEDSTGGNGGSTLPAEEKTVTYYKNIYGTDTVKDLFAKWSHKPESEFAIMSPGVLENPGYKFAGWCEQADGTGKILKPGDMYKMGTSDVTFYAVWEETGTGENPGGEGTIIPPAPINPPPQQNETEQPEKPANPPQTEQPEKPAKPEKPLKPEKADGKTSNDTEQVKSEVPKTSDEAPITIMLSLILMTSAVLAGTITLYGRNHRK